MTDDVVEKWKTIAWDNPDLSLRLVREKGDALAAEVSRLRAHLTAVERLAAEWSELEDGTWSTRAERIRTLIGDDES